ncbi:MAG: superoxide dismutase [Ignavibacteriae bacterium]|nr:superoxide dismutase [Ignavibacteriota bacterium]
MHSKRICPEFPTTSFQTSCSREARRAWELHQAGVIRELYFRADKSLAVLILECADGDEAKEILATLPLVCEGLIDFEIISLAAYPGFARLFSD